MDPEYARRATPPQRFVDALSREDGYVLCLKQNCGLPMVVDPMAFSQTRSIVAEWRRHNTKPVPLRLLKLFMRCLNGHTESWHAEPVGTVSQMAAREAAEEAALAGPLTTKECSGCGESYQGGKYSRFCPDCKVDS